MNAVVYARYSSSNQREESIEGQIRVCSEYAKKKGYSVVKVYADRAMTGTNDNRPEFQQMIKDCEKHFFEVVIVYKTDRFSRNRYDSAIYKSKLKKNNVCIEYAAEPIPDDSTGIILEGMLESMAEWYSVNLSENTKRGKKENALKKHSNGGVTPFGYVRADGNLLPDPKKSTVVQFIFKSYTSGLSMATIVQQCRDFYGVKLSTSGIKAMLKNVTYIGMYRYVSNDGEVFEQENHHEPIVDLRTFRLAEKRREENKRSPNAGKGKKKNMLAGLAHCGLCGAPYVICHSYRNGIPMYYRMYCLGRKERKDCSNSTKRMELIEQAAVSAIKENVLNKKILRSLAAEAFALQETATDDTIKELQENLNSVSKAKQNIMIAIEQGIITSTTKQRLEELEFAEADLQAKIAEEKHTAPDTLTLQEIEKFLFDYCSGDFSDEVFRRELARAFINDILVFEDYVEINMQVAGKTMSIKQTI